MRREAQGSGVGPPGCQSNVQLLVIGRTEREGGRKSRAETFVFKSNTSNSSYALDVMHDL